MIRRAFVLAAAAALLILTPSVAMAYEAPGYSSAVSDSTPAAGQCITMTVDGGPANAGKVLTLNVTGPSTKTLTATADASGVATFSVCLSVVGDYTLTATNADGAVVADQTITVHAVSAAAAPGQLSFTGSDTLPLAAGGALLVLIGVGAVVYARRRNSSQVSV
jgi:hypothetical protein